MAAAKTVRQLFYIVPSSLSSSPGPSPLSSPRGRMAPFVFGWRAKRAFEKKGAEPLQGPAPFGCMRRFFFIPLCEIQHIP